MESERQLVLPVTGQELGRFIMSLLGQRRTIERMFETPSLIVRHEWVLNIVNVINQRVSQNISSLATFRCSFYFADGTTKTVFTIDDFVAFNDLSLKESLGVDITVSYIVEFPGVNAPERQDIRIEVFSDSRIKEFPHRDEIGHPLLKYTINASNLTWGEDLSGHLNAQFDQIVVRDTLTWVVNAWKKYITRSLFAIILPTIMMIITFFMIPFSDSISNDQRQQFTMEEMRRIGDSLDIEHINKKFDLILRTFSFKPNIWPILKPYGINWRILFLLFSIISVIFVWQKTKKLSHLRIVAFNKHTTEKLNRLVREREYIIWAVYIALLVGAIASVAAARIDKILF